MEGGGLKWIFCEGRGKKELVSKVYGAGFYSTVPTLRIWPW